jgi:hypothetical protein
MTTQANPSLPRTSRTTSFLAGMVTMAVAVAICALLLEGMTRFVLDDGMNFDVEMWKYAREIKQRSADPAVGHEHRPNSSAFLMGAPVSINSLGMRDREFTPAKPADTVRIMMLGDSLTFGWGVKAEDTPSKLMEASLNQGLDKPRYEVMNTGVGNYNTAMEVAYFFDKGRLLNPDVVVLNYFINDAEPTPIRKDSSLIEHSEAAVMVAGAYDKVARTYFGRADWQAYYRGLYGQSEPGWLAAKDAVARLADYCREHGIKLLFVNYPELHVLKSYPFADVTQSVEAVAKDNNVAFVDLLPSIAALEPTTLWVSNEDAHPDALANEHFAKVIETALKREFPETFSLQPAPARSGDAASLGQ